MGRPSKFSEALADAICDHIADGRSLITICALEEMPAKTTVFRWLAEHEAFRGQYAHARESQADALFDEILVIADNDPDPQKARLRVDARKWMAGKLRPKKYGEKVGLTGDDGGPVKLEIVWAGRSGS